VTTEAVNMEAVALAVFDVLALLEPEPPVIAASVSEAYATQRKGERAWWRVAVAITVAKPVGGVRAVAWQPRFETREDAEAYREAVADALDRAT
jgi:hypothetical protein